MLFNNLACRPVVTDFSAGYVSSDGGLLLLRQIDEGLGICRSLAACFRDERNPVFVEHSLRELVAQRLLGLAAGYEDLNDHNLLRLMIGTSRHEAIRDENGRSEEKEVNKWLSNKFFHEWNFHLAGVYQMGDV